MPSATFSTKYWFMPPAEGFNELIPLYLADIDRIGFDLVDQRTLYRDARVA